MASPSLRARQTPKYQAPLITTATGSPHKRGVFFPLVLGNKEALGRSRPAARERGAHLRARPPRACAGPGPKGASQGPGDPSPRARPRRRSTDPVRGAWGARGPSASPQPAAAATGPRSHTRCDSVSGAPSQGPSPLQDPLTLSS